jgi:hypothetical protein
MIWRASPSTFLFLQEDKNRIDWFDEAHDPFNPRIEGKAYAPTEMGP